MIQVSSRFSTEHKEGTPQKDWNDKVIQYLTENKSKIDLVVATAAVGSANLPDQSLGMVEQRHISGDEIGMPVMAIRDNQRFGFNIVEPLEQYGYESTREKIMKLEPISHLHPWALVDYKSPNIYP